MYIMKMNFGFVNFPVNVKNIFIPFILLFVRIRSYMLIIVNNNMYVNIYEADAFFFKLN